MIARSLAVTGVALVLTTAFAVPLALLGAFVLAERRAASPLPAAPSLGVGLDPEALARGVANRPASDPGPPIDWIGDDASGAAAFGRRARFARLKPKPLKLTSIIRRLNESPDSVNGLRR